MQNRNFAHLHNHLIFSIQDSLINPSDIAIKAKELGFKYLAITDHGNCSGAIKFSKECLKNDIIPIIGQESYLVENIHKKEKGEKRSHIIVWCQNEIGWKNLLQMNTIANLEGHYYRPRVSPDIILSHSEGLIFSTACVSSFIHTDWGMELLRELVKKDQCVGELMPHKHPLQLETNEKVLRLRDKYDSFRLVASSDCHFINKEDKKSHEVLLAIKSKKVMSDPTRWKFTEGFDCYFPTADEMISMFQYQDQLDRETYISAMKETIKIAKKCENFRITSKPISLPKVPSLKDVDENEYLKYLCVEGLKKKGLDNQEYFDRMEYEYKVICDKLLPRYFLVVWDLYRWAKDEGMIISHGRGSSGCSLIAYLLGITNLDPIKWKLPFSRFLDEERTDYADFDTDWSDVQRERIIQYLRDTYGEDNVAGISTFLVLKSRSAIRDVCRTFEIPLDEADELAKSVPFDSNLKSEIENENDIVKKYKKKYPEVINHTLKIEKTLRGVSRHAAGIVISDQSLRDGTRCNLDNREGHIVINWGKDDAEHQGLIKLDILGLSTLTVLDEAKRLIKENHGVDIDYENLDINDPDVLKMISDGNTSGIFQAGTVPMTLLIKEMGIEKFTHFVDAIALVRPGSKEAGATEKYIKRKHGEKWKPKHPIYEDVLKDTYSSIVYQEQIMNIIHRVAGLSYATSNQIRRIIGKKRDASEFDKYKDMFLEGCKKQQTLSEDEANEFWDGLQYAASYLFNFSHSIFYAMLGMNTAWLKYYYPAEFLAASFSFIKEEHKPDLIREARRLNLKIYPPKVGISDALRWRTQNNILYCPFAEIKGIGEKTLNKLSSNKSGFFTPDDGLLKGKVKTILTEIDAFNPESPLPINAQHYFDIDICDDWKNRYPKLCDLYGVSFSEIPIEKALNGELRGFEFVKKVEPFKTKWPEIESCKDCELHKECDHKILPSVSTNNIVILGEAGYKDEHKEGKPFVGRAGEVLWKELKKHKLKRKMFHVCNSVACAPLKSKNPKEIHVDACRKFLIEQLNFIKPSFILSLGNFARYALIGESKGIMKANATTQWNEEFGCYIIFSMHPSSTFHSGDNKEKFELAIKHFSDVLENLGGI